MSCEQTFNVDEADLIVINSCGFIEDAKKESLESVYAARKNSPSAKIVLAGCLAERYADVFRTDLPEVDAVFGNGDISKIDSVIKTLQDGGRPVEVYAQRGVCSGERRTLLGFPGSAFVKITEGCSNHCSFCAIPLIRGELRSRPAFEIVEEIKSLVSRGIVEVNLIGQDLAAYGTGLGDCVFEDVGKSGEGEDFCEVSDFDSERSSLSRLMEEISKIPGKFNIRLLYIHPDHFNFDIMPVMQNDPRFLPYFDIPFQSGDDETIRRMNRKGTAEKYIALVKKIRKSLPGAVVRTTFLAGFPGEDEESALNTLNFLKAVQSDWSGCFSYSREEDTPAHSFKKQVSSKVAKARAEELCSVQAEITQKRLASYVGKEVEVLVEELVEGEEGLAIGRAWFQAPEVDGNVVVRYDRNDVRENSAVKPGNFVRVKVTASAGVDLDSRFVSEVAIPQKIQQDENGGISYATEMGS